MFIKNERREKKIMVIVRGRNQKKDSTINKSKF